MNGTEVGVLQGVEVDRQTADADRVLTPEAVAFVAGLQREFGGARESLLQARRMRAAAFREGMVPDFLEATAHVRASEWRVAAAPADLEDRRVEITGPADRRMIINALNSGASAFMADLEDALSPTWDNLIGGQAALMDAVRRRIDFEDPRTGKRYHLGENPATLIVRPRGWHLPDRHVLVDGEPISGSLLDFGLYFFHNARELIERGSGPYFYLPKLEGHREARLWNAVFGYAQEALGIPTGAIRATVLIETLPAAFEMDEILFELREHAAGLNAGRWDYIFSGIKFFGHRSDFVLPDRDRVTMTVPFMRAYTDLLVQTCHRRGAHAIGGMSAFVPNRSDPKVTERAFEKVRADKEREADQGFDGTWVAHPDLVSVARAAFDPALGRHPHQKDILRTEVAVTARDLLQPPPATVTHTGFTGNVRVCIQYLAAWLGGTGAVAIDNLMEDAATAEIARAQLHQWIRHAVPVDGREPASREMYRTTRTEELAALRRTAPDGAIRHRLDQAAELLDTLVLSDDFVEFLTLPGYSRLA